MAADRDNTHTAKRILKVMKQISEHLTQDEIITIRSNIANAIELAKDRDKGKVKGFLRIYVKMLQFRSGISVNLLKQSVRSLLMITHNEHLGKLAHEMFTKYIASEHPSITIGMYLDDELLKVYLKALGSGHEDAKHIRLMVVGMYGVGKTTLVNKLLNKPDAEKEPDSTVGIDISVDACEIAEDGTWESTKFEDKDKMYGVRLQQLFRSHNSIEGENTKASKLDSSRSGQVHQEKSVVVEGKIQVSNRQTQQPTEIINIAECKTKLQKEEAEENNRTGNQSYCSEMEIANKRAEQPNIMFKRPTISMWDFAGQSVYYSTHHFFLNPRAIYLLVLDLSKELNEKVVEGRDVNSMRNIHLGNKTTKHFTQLDAFQFWMRSIYIYTKQKRITDSKEEYKPTIILIGTHKDTLGPEKGNPDTYAENYFKKALDSIIITPAKELVYEKKFFLGKNDQKGKFTELRSNIYDVAKKQPFWGEKIPGKFIPLEREVEKKKSEKAEIMLLQELEDVSKQSHYPLNQNEIQVFLKFQHAFGNILHYDKANPDMIVLKPQWIIDAFKLFISHKSTNESDEWHEFTKKAVLSPGLVDDLLRADQKWFKFKQEIIKYMEHLDIIAKPVLFKDSKDNVVGASTSQAKDRNVEWQVTISANADILKSQDFYFMPCMLPGRPSAETIREMLKSDGESSPVLCMYIRGVFLPPFVFHRILATCIKKMPVLEYLDEYVLYSGLGAFKIDETTILSIWSWGNMIYIKVTSCHTDGKQRMSKANLTDVQRYFDSLVKRLFNMDGSQYSDNVEISFYVTCPICPELYPFDHKTYPDGSPIDQKCGLLLVKDLQLKTDKICNPKRHHFKSDRALSKWFHIDSNVALPADHKLSRDFGETFLADLAEIIHPRNIHSLAAGLDIGDTKLGHIQQNHGHPASNFTFHVLYEWKQMNESLSILFSATTVAECNKKEFYRILNDDLSIKHTQKLQSTMKKICQEKLKTTKLDPAALTEISKGVGEVYWLLGIRLGVPETVIQLMDGSKSQIILNILSEWNKSNIEDNKNKELIRAMIKSGCNMDGIHSVFAM